jgi:hypothetical protein
LLVQSIVDIALQNLVLASVMLHRMVGRLLAQAYFVLAHHHFDIHEAFFLVRKLSTQFVCLGELILQFFFHLGNTLHVLIQLSPQGALQMFVF